MKGAWIMYHENTNGEDRQGLVNNTHAPGASRVNLATTDRCRKTPASAL